ncbi:peptide ABC transporter ATP-binding protein [Brevibacillus reuszeri]|uniref:Peptide ABC transporter ATP-binding protein n=1 Tax=Brevibacillus reuszeri TaxID=54915 RepID=A0A0K9YL24_9BACL|nr:ABC transporter ATP-binding protein [Brevibacillus reuszeri]KNB69356.1 peptide ABC transporter ATP-binding protein [Brevibacillus reuszeri]MED1860341.1 ABC transporter ATP-binding protein [Brevibacillus reuszeri]GED70773.1 peptide ABC transporter ATP-binding protein [Brevibacillus reuszeri]
MEGRSPVLAVKGLTTQFVGRKNTTITVVDNIDLQVGKGETLGIVGESGCGKSVTSLSIMRLLGKNGRVVSGQVNFEGTDILTLEEKEMRKIRGNRLAMIFQEPMTSLNPVLTIGRQIGEVLQLHTHLGGEQRKQRTIELIAQVGIPRAQDIYNEYPHRLSGGMRQRVMIAMAMACQPQLLIADEPTTALDVTIQAQMLSLIRDMRAEAGMSVMLITHDLGVVAEMCDRVLVMYAGQVIESADVRTLLRRPKHPYTIGLIQSVPHNAKGERRLYAISGNVPSPGEWPQGCRFAPRCQEAMTICRTQSPPLSRLRDGSECRCWLHEPGAAAEGRDRM